MQPITAISLVLFFGMFSTSALGQTEYDTSLNAQTGIQLYGSYFADFDRVGLYNRNVQFNIKLFGLPGRELLGSRRLTAPFEEEPSFFASYLQCDGSQPLFAMNVYWIDSNGAKRRYMQKDYGTGPCASPTPPSWDNRTLLSLDADGSIFFTGQYQSNGPTTAYAAFKNGTKRFFRDVG